jgi:hypothetical protein
MCAGLKRYREFRRRWSVTKGGIRSRRVEIRMGRRLRLSGRVRYGLIGLLVWIWVAGRGIRRILRMMRLR